MLKLSSVISVMKNVATNLQVNIITAKSRAGRIILASFRLRALEIASYLMILAVVSGQTQPRSNQGDIIFDPVAELTQSPSAGTVIGGVPADPKDWPASFYSSSDSGRCTSTLVGPRALLTAAHCVGNGMTATIRFRDGKMIKGVCRHASSYRQDVSADYALCLMASSISGISYETVNVDPRVLVVNGKLLLTGYGCTMPPGVGGNDGIYRIGFAEIKALPDPNDKDPNYIVTQGDVALCFGDSGGGGYIIEQQAGSRKLVSINSRANTRDLSWLSSTSTPPALDFLKHWSKDNAAPICGIDPGVDGCR